jgi:hypothetical protein
MAVDEFGQRRRIGDRRLAAEKCEKVDHSAHRTGAGMPGEILSNMRFFRPLWPFIRQKSYRADVFPMLVIWCGPASIDTRACISCGGNAQRSTSGVPRLSHRSRTAAPVFAGKVPTHGSARQ